MRCWQLLRTLFHTLPQDIFYPLFIDEELMTQAGWGILLMCSWGYTQVSQLSVVRRCSIAVSTDFKDGEAGLRTHWVVWLVLYLVWGHHDNQLCQPWERKSPTWAWAHYPPCCALWVCTLITGSVPGTFRAPCRCWNEGRQDITKRAGPATQLTPWCRRQYSLQPETLQR